MFWSDVAIQTFALVTVLAVCLLTVFAVRRVTHCTLTFVMDTLKRFDYPMSTVLTAIINSIMIVKSTVMTNAINQQFAQVRVVPAVSAV
jgi:uncharacterized integral membrane protein